MEKAPNIDGVWIGIFFHKIQDERIKQAWIFDLCHSPIDVHASACVVVCPREWEWAHVCGGSARTYEVVHLKIDRRMTKNGTSKQIQLLRNTDVYTQVKPSIIARKQGMFPALYHDWDMVPLSREWIIIIIEKNRSCSMGLPILQSISGSFQHFGCWKLRLELLWVGSQCWVVFYQSDCDVQNWNDRLPTEAGWCARADSG